MKIDGDEKRSSSSCFVKRSLSWKTRLAVFGCSPDGIHWRSKMSFLKGSVWKCGRGVPFTVQESSRLCAKSNTMPKTTHLNLTSGNSAYNWCVGVPRSWSTQILKTYLMTFIGLHWCWAQTISLEPQHSTQYSAWDEHWICICGRNRRLDEQALL